MNRDSIAAVAAVAVLAVWTLVALYFDVVSHDYAGLTIVTPIMGLLAAWLFVRGIHIGRNGGLAVTHRGQGEAGKPGEAGQPGRGSGGQGGHGGAGGRGGDAPGRFAALVLAAALLVAAITGLVLWLNHNTNTIDSNQAKSQRHAEIDRNTLRTSCRLNNQRWQEFALFLDRLANTEVGQLVRHDRTLAAEIRANPQTIIDCAQHFGPNERG